MQKTTRLQRLLAVIVAVFMAVCCLPLNAFAESVVNFQIEYLEDGHPVKTQDVKATLQGDGYVLTSDLDLQAPTGYEMVNVPEKFYPEEDDVFTINVKKLPAVTITFNVEFEDEDTHRPVGSQEGIKAQLDDQGLVDLGKISYNLPSNYVLSSVNGPYAVEDGETVIVYVKNTVKMAKVTWNFVLADGTSVGTASSEVTAGVHNYNEFTSLVPTGYKMTVGGDFFINEGEQTINIGVETINKDVAINIQFKDGDEVVAAGDYFVPAGVQNYSVLEQYVPEGYKMTVSGDFTVTAGDKIVVPIEKINKDVAINIQFKDGDEVVAGGDYFVPAGVQNYSVLEQYVPEGYKMTVSGDFTVTAGDKIVVPVEKISNTVIMNIRFMDGETFVAGGDYTLTAGVQNYSALQSYVPEGYVLEVSGDFMAAEGAKLDVPVKKITNEVIMNILFKDGDEVVAGGDYFVPAGVQNYNVLGKYVPAGYSMDVSGDFMAAEGAKLEVPVSKIENAVIMNIRFIDSTTGEFVAGGDYFLPEGVQNYKVLTQYVPEGYKMDVSGDFTVAEGTSLDVPVSKLPAQIIMNIRFMEGETFIAGGDYFVTEGVNNYSVLADLGYLPEGYEMDVAGDFMAKEGAKLDVPVHKIKDGGEDSSSSSDNTTTVSSNNNKSNNNQVVKAEAPADNTAKVMPQTGLNVETPVVFGVMMVAALAGAGAYLFAIRKKLN